MRLGTNDVVSSAMQDFRKLVVWQKAHAFALEIRRVTEGFPRELRDQIRSAAESIVNNIVEGCGASSRKEFARYLDISIKSASERTTSSSSRETSMF